MVLHLICSHDHIHLMPSFAWYCDPLEFGVRSVPVKVRTFALHIICWDFNFFPIFCFFELFYCIFRIFEIYAFVTLKNSVIMYDFSNFSDSKGYKFARFQNYFMLQNDTTFNVLWEKLELVTIVRCSSGLPECSVDDQQVRTLKLQRLSIVSRYL